MEFRNIYFKPGIQPVFKGSEIGYYTGKVVYNAPDQLVQAEYNREHDLYITCACNLNKYKAFIKKN